MATRPLDVDISLLTSSRARFFDVDKEPQKKILSAIRHYEKSPLLPLEETIRPLENCIDGLEADVWVAKQNTVDYVKDNLLTQDERASIQLYTMQPLVSHLLNEALRKDDRQCLLPWFSFLKLLLAALWKLDSVQRTIWRGAKDSLGAQFQKGKKFFWWGIASCTSSRKIFETTEFTGNISVRTLFQIDSLDARDIRNYSHYESQEEHLLLPCSYFEVLEVIDTIDDLCIVHVRQQEPPMALIKPPLVIACSTETKRDESEGQKIVVEAPIQQLTRNQRRRQKQKERERAQLVDTHPTSTIEKAQNNSTEIVVRSSSCMQSDTSDELNPSMGQTGSSEITLNFNRLKTKPRKSITVIKCIRMTANDRYFLICPDNRLCLIDKEGNEYWSTHRTFDVDDICYSTFLNQFLILADYDLFSLDLQRPTKLKTEITNFARHMDECTCHDNLFLVIKDFGGATVEVWDMKSNWQLHKRYEQPLSCKRGQGICTIRFSTDGNYLGVTLIEPSLAKAFFQLRTAEDMKILKVVERLFYEGHCNHYILPLPHNEFLVYKYSEKVMFLIDSRGKCKQPIQYEHGVCTMALVDNCLAIQSKRPDQLHFHDL